MSTPLGHALGAMALYSAGSGVLPEGMRGRRGLAAAAVVSLVPDLDIVIYTVSKWAFGAPHRGISHSLMFCTLLGCVWFLAAGGWRSKRWGLALLLLIAVSDLHLLLDWAMKCGPPLKLFRPFSDAGYNSPVQLVPTAYYSSGSLKSLVGMLIYPRNILAFMLEVALFAPLLIAMRAIRRRPHATGVSVMICSSAVLISSSAVLLTVILYN